MAFRMRSSLLSMALVAAVLCLSARWAFVAAPSPKAESALSLRGAEVAAAGVSTVIAPLAASAADELIEYPMAGEITVTNIIYFFVITLGGTAFAFASYFALTKLKII
eukprot:CAMPEP_0178401372 /NCGR_PEP_ID=MMETSP0689_2-20121128/16268_1 /TAXON_ID=160604 /ORGANISM="Amphidinium massartii, Strain CS-259" /LENGTH=107 /DNA_ID=CAMNT_0020022191 /DNA_START=77 /DNA_END=400 /DNA_ORIENTATION=+